MTNAVCNAVTNGSPSIPDRTYPTVPTRPTKDLGTSVPIHRHSVKASRADAWMALTRGELR